MRHLLPDRRGWREPDASEHRPPGGPRGHGTAADPRRPRHGRPAPIRRIPEDGSAAHPRRSSAVRRQFDRHLRIHRLQHHLRHRLAQLQHQRRNLRSFLRPLPRSGCRWNGQRPRTGLRPLGHPIVHLRARCPGKRLPRYRWHREPRKFRGRPDASCLEQRPAEHRQHLLLHRQLQLGNASRRRPRIRRARGGGRYQPRRPFRRNQRSGTILGQLDQDHRWILRPGQLVDHEQHRLPGRAFRRIHGGSRRHSGGPVRRPPSRHLLR